MKIRWNISEKKSVLNCLLLAILSAGIFLLHETGPGRASVPREAAHVAMGFQRNQRDVPSIYEVNLFPCNPGYSQNATSLILKKLSDKVGRLVSVISNAREVLHIIKANPSQHFRNRSLIPEGPFHLFS